MIPLERIRRRLRARRGVIMLITAIFMGTVGLTCLFGLHYIAVTTSAHSRLTETAQSAAYAAASAVENPAGSTGVITIEPIAARAAAAQIIAANMDGKFGLEPGAVEWQVSVENTALRASDAELLMGANCQPMPGAGVPAGQQLAWRDSFGECHLTSGVQVRVSATIRPCLFSGQAGKVCPPVTVTGFGFADYAFRTGTRTAG